MRLMSFRGLVSIIDRLQRGAVPVQYMRLDFGLEDELPP